MTETELSGLSPSVRRLVQKVSNRVADAATVQQIRALADQAIAGAGENALTVAEIRELADLAISRAQRVTGLMARLAVLLDETGGLCEPQ